MKIFITGGARSGKSDFAERYAMRLAPAAVYIATSQIWDDEMADRIERHRQTRAQSGYRWRTLEEPCELAAALRRLEAEAGEADTGTAAREEAALTTGNRPAVLVDCLTLWLTNWMLRLDEEARQLYGAADEGEANAGRSGASAASGAGSTDSAVSSSGSGHSSPASAASSADSGHFSPASPASSADSGDSSPASAASSADSSHSSPASVASSADSSHSSAASAAYGSGGKLAECYAERRLAAVIDELTEAVAAFSGQLLLVSNEVGSGIVPAYPLGRRFRDAAGRMNRRLAGACDQAFLVVAGFPLDLKAHAFRLGED